MTTRSFPHAASRANNARVKPASSFDSNPVTGGQGTQSATASARLSMVQALPHRAGGLRAIPLLHRYEPGLDHKSGRADSELFPPCHGESELRYGGMSSDHVRDARRSSERGLLRNPDTVSYSEQEMTKCGHLYEGSGEHTLRDSSAHFPRYQSGGRVTMMAPRERLSCFPSNARRSSGARRTLH